MSACLPGQSADTTGAGTTGAGTTGAGGTPLVFGSDGNIAVATLDGRQRRELTRVAVGAMARDPAWSPDGRLIAYSYTPPLTAARGPGGMLPLPVTDIYVMGADGSQPRLLLEHPAPGSGYETPVWAPDGATLFVTYSELIMESNVVRDQLLELASVPLDGKGDGKGQGQGGGRRTVAPRGTWPTLSPDGKRLAFLSSEPEGQALVVCDADGKNARPLIPTGQMEGLAAPRFSPDGRQIVFSAIAPMAPVPTTTPVPGRRPLAGPDGPRRALAHGLPMDLYLIDAGGGAPRRLTQLGEDNPAAVWAPDGRRLAILSGGGLYVLNADGSDVRAIDQRGGHGTIDWRRA